MAERGEYGAKAPGPCYPNWPSTNNAFVQHRRSEDGRTCARCGAYWDAIEVHSNEGTDRG